MDSAGAAWAYRMAWYASSRRGRRTGQRHEGFPRNVGGPAVSTTTKRPKASQTNRLVRGRLPFVVRGSEPQAAAWYRRAKENEARRDGRPGVAAP